MDLIGNLINLLGNCVTLCFHRQVPVQGNMGTCGYFSWESKRVN